MDFNGLRLEYALDGRSNLITWKDRMEEVLEDNGLKEFIDSDVPKLGSSDATLLDAWKKKTTKTRRIYRQHGIDRRVMQINTRNLRSFRLGNMCTCASRPRGEPCRNYMN